MGEEKKTFTGWDRPMCSRLQVCEEPVRSITKIEVECLNGVPWRKWRFPAVAHCKAGC